EVAVVEQVQVELVAEHGRDGTLLREPGERVRDESEDVELQGRPRSRLPMRCETTRNQDASVREVDLEHAGIDERQREARVELEHVVGDPRPHRGHLPELAAALFLHREPVELERVVLVVPGRRELRARHAELGAAPGLAVEPDHRSAAGPLRVDHGCGLAVDPQRRAFGEALLVLARLLHEERPVEAVRLADAAYADELVRDLRASISAVACSRVIVWSTFSRRNSSARGQSLPRNTSATRSSSTGVLRSSISPPSTSAQKAASSPSYGRPTLPALTKRTAPICRSCCMCVCPATTARCWTPARIASRSSSGVAGVTISSSLRGVA